MYQSALRWLFAGFFTLAVIATPSHAQVTTGTILGTVTDSSGAAVAGAKVVITNVAQGTAFDTLTNEAGSYNQPFLIPGTYTVAIEHSGFKRTVRSDVLLEVSQTARVDFALEIGAVNETVDVVAAAPLVRADSAEIGEVINEQAVRELPLNGRNFAQLVYLVPGVTPGQSGENLSGASTFNPRGPSNFNALGSQANFNAWLVDGIDNNEYTFNTVIVAPTVESVREFKVMTGTYSAEFGRGAGVVSISTKSGSNEFHGTLFEFLRNDKFDAYGYFAPRVNSRGEKVAKPPLRRNQFGGALHGPIIRNKTFFFADYAGLRERKAQSFINTVPDERMRVGDFSHVANQWRIYNPFTARVENGRVVRDQFENNVIPQQYLNQVGLNVASIYPLPNYPGIVDNYRVNVARATNDDVWTGRVDHSFSEHDNLFVRYTWNKFKLDAPQGQANCCLFTPPEAAARFDLGPFVAGIQNTRLKTQGMAINESHVFRPNLLNELRLGFARTVPSTFQSDYGTRAAESLGIRNINVNELATGLPNINIDDLTGLSGGPGFLPVNPKQTHYQIEDMLVWVKGNMNWKFGYRVLRRDMQPLTHTNTRGNINLSRNFVNSGTGGTGGHGLAALLLGYINTADRGFLTEPYYIRTWEHAAFVQNDWRVRRNLTVNLGLRYDVFRPPVEERDRLTNFDVTNRRLVYAGDDGISRTAGLETKYNNWSPRIGLAWSLSERTVISTGYSISYFPIPVSASNMLGVQIPWTTIQRFDAPSNTPSPEQIVTYRTIEMPFPTITFNQPRTTAELNNARTGVKGHSFKNETPYMQTWSFNIERQLPGNMVWEIGYAGSKGTHLVMAYQLQETRLPTAQGQSIPSRRPIQELANLGDITMFEPRNSSTYHGLQTRFNKRYSSGLQFLVSYTWAKALDYGGSPASGGGWTGGPQTITNFEIGGRGPSGFDVRHRAVISHVYDLPGKGLGGVAGFVFGNWQWSGITTLTTGRPFNVFQNRDVNLGAPAWPDRVCDGRLDNPDPNYWFDMNCFVPPQFGQYGNTGRGSLYTPGHVNFDQSFSKNFPLGTERAALQFRAEAFNLLNTPYFGRPNDTVNPSITDPNAANRSAGRITSTLADQRSLQFALKLEF